MLFTTSNLSEILAFNFANFYIPLPNNLVEFELPMINKIIEKNLDDEQQLTATSTM